MYWQRDYRRRFAGDLELCQVQVRETDLAILLPPGIWNEELAQQTRRLIAGLRADLEEYMKRTPDFAATHQPFYAPLPAPPMALAMTRAGNAAGVGPMAAVAGAFAQAVGEFLLPLAGETLVENGGDLYLAGRRERLVGIFAGPSPFGGKLALRVPAQLLPLGICTSSGTVGPSFSYGQADAAVILAPNALLADAVATATANRVQTEADVEAAVEFAGSVGGVLGAVVIKNKALAAWGQVELVPVQA